MNLLFLLRLSFIFSACLSVNTAIAQGLSDEDDEWETETLDALQPIWIQSRAKTVPQNTPQTTTKSATPVNRPRIALTGASLPTAAKQDEAKIAAKQAETKVVAESTATPKIAPRKTAAIGVRSRPLTLTKKTMANGADLSVSTPEITLAEAKKEPEIKLPENLFLQNDLALNLPSEAIKQPVTIVRSKPLQFDKKITNSDLTLTNNDLINTPAINTPLPQDEKAIALPENSMPIGTVLANVSLSPSIVYTETKSIEKVTIEQAEIEKAAAEKTEIEKAAAEKAEIEKAAKPTNVADKTVLAASSSTLKPTTLRTSTFNPLPATKPSFAIETPNEALPKGRMKTGAIDKSKVTTPVETKIEVADAHLNIPAETPPVKSGIAAAKSPAKEVLAAQKVTTAELEGDLRVAYANAFEQFRVSNYTQAEPYLKQIVATEPRFADGYRMLVECYEKEGNYKKAITFYQKYLEFYPNNEKDWFNLSLLYSKTKDMNKAVEACERATDINPDYDKGKRRLVNLYAATGRTSDLAAQTSDEGIFKYGLVLYKQKKLTEAIERLNKMQTPTADAHYLRGVCYRKLNEDDNAIEAYNEAINLHPTHFDAITELGVLYYNQKKYDLAASYFGQAYSLKTSDMEVAFFYGRALVFNKEAKRAITYLEKVVAATPKNTDAKRFLTYAYYEADKQQDSEETKTKAKNEAPTGLTENTSKIRNLYYNDGLKAMQSEDFHGAIQKFEQAAKEDNREPRIPYSIGLVHFNLKNYAKAVEYFNKTVKLDPNYVKAYEALGKTYYAQENADKATENYELAIQKGAATVANYSELATVYSFSNQAERAVIYYEKAVKLAPENAEIRFNYGTTYLGAHQYTKAIEQLQKATEYAPQYWAAYYNIGQAYLRQEKLDEAMEIGEKLIKLNPQYANGYTICAIVCNKRGDSYNQDKYAKMAKKLDPSLPFD
ncbi:MAG: hypothetical protein RI894_870 [Bacteroidota bacterium]|jgi:tetratricopeptide (TPR) repeat protein